MFDLANDRLSYSELLRPDAGYTLDFAVGTTYSLDLEALLGVPVSLGLLDDADTGKMDSPLYVLEAIRKSADRIALFCNAGGIKLPNKIQSVYSLLENSVFPVKLSTAGNFHPKLWVLKYSQKGSPSYIKLLVMSRNLTFDSSIDISASLQGEMGSQPSEKNRSLSDFLRYVAQFARKKKSQVLSLADDVLKVAAFEVAPPFEDYEFYPMGIPGYSGANSPLFDGKKMSLFAVSPFLSDETVQQMTSFKGPRSIVTRKSSITPAVKAAFDHVYVTKDVLSDNEFAANQDIHAKIYYSTTPHGNYLYLGSANASRNAFRRNVECLLRLRYKLYGMGYKKFCADFIPAENCPYEEINTLPELQDENLRDKEIDKALREAVYALKHATVTEAGDRYCVQIEAKALKTAERVMLAPLQRPSLTQRMEECTLFSGLLLKELSEFYVLSIDEKKLIVKIKTYGMPKNRDEEIYRSIIDSKAKFMSYLAFMLSGNLSDSSEETTDDVLSALQAGPASLIAHASAAVYEQMLRVFHQNPAKLSGISDMIRRLDPDVVGEDFLAMYRQFETAAKRVRK